MKIRRLNEDAKRFYVDEIVSAQGGKTETERHSFATCDELKQYVKDANLTKDDIANCGGCDIKDLCEDLVKDAHYDSLAVNEPTLYLPTDKGGKLEVAIGAEKQDEDDWDIYIEVRDNGTFCFEIPNSSIAKQIDEGRNPYLTSLTFERAEEICNTIRSYLIDIDQDNIYNILVNDLKCKKAAVEKFWNSPELKEEVEKLHTKPNGEYLVKADSGKGYTAFSRDNVAIGGIDNEDADSDDKAIDKFKKNEYSECLNEEYFDTHEFRIQKYEDDIPELMAGMHDDYMEGRLAAEFYAKALEKVYNVLAECDHKYTLSQGIKTEDDVIRDIFTETSNDNMNELFDIKLDARGFGGSGNNVHVGPGSMPLTASVEDNEDDETLNEESEKYYAAKYTAVDNSGNKVVKKICFRCDGTIEDAENAVDSVIKEPYTDVKIFGSVLKGVAEKDGFELVESVLHEDKETISKFAQLAASHKFKNLKTQLEDEDTCVTCQGKLLPEDKNGIRKCESCGNFYFGKQLLICTKCGSTEIDPGRDCKCRHCGYEFAEDQGKCVTCGGDIVKNDAETNKCKHCGNLYDIVTGELIKKKTNESVDEYDDDYCTSYDDSIEECSGIKAHKVIMGEDIDDSVELDDLDGVEGPDGDKTEDIEFIMAEYIPESFLIDSVKKIDSVTYEVSVEGKVVTVKFDPKWGEYVYTIDGRGPYSHRSYEFISRDIYDFVMSQRSADYELDDLDD